MLDSSQTFASRRGKAATSYDGHAAQIQSNWRGSGRKIDNPRSDPPERRAPTEELFLLSSSVNQVSSLRPIRDEVPISQADAAEINRLARAASLLPAPGPSVIDLTDNVAQPKPFWKRHPGICVGTIGALVTAGGTFAVEQTVGTFESYAPLLLFGLAGSGVAGLLLEICTTERVERRLPGRASWRLSGIPPAGLAEPEVPRQIEGMDPWRIDVDVPRAANPQ